MPEQPSLPAAAAVRGVRKGKKTTGASANKPKAEGKERRRAAVKESLRTREQYERLSLRWCEKLLDAVSEAVLEQAAHYITPEDYDGVVEERAAGDLCGYPLCSRKPKKLEKRYHISLARRKVFDISEQGNFCGSSCMVGSRIYRHQLPEDPLYMRDRSQEQQIEIAPLKYNDDTAASTEVAAGSKAAKAVEDRSGGERLESTDNDPLEWYRRSLMKKMNIPESVAAASPLQIVEHDSGDAEFDVSETVAKLSFADIEGFEPEADSARVKRAIRKVARVEAVAQVNKKDAGIQSMESKGMAAKDGLAKDSENEVLKLTVEGRPPDVQQRMDSLAPSYSDGEDSDDSDEPEPTIAGSEHFAKLFAPEESRRGGPSLSLFGRMWTLIDRMATKNTVEFLRDLGDVDDIDELQTKAVEYYSSLGDQAMAKRQELLVDNIIRELDEIKRRLRIKLELRREVQMLVSTLELGSNMAMFSEGELQLLGIAFFLALAQSAKELQNAVDNPESSAELDVVLCSLGSDRSLLDMVARRLHEPY
ncbi:hypothetical protein H4R20_004896 [Coemansia guatemalensis]|uniref:RNA polymerase II subunit B1 CTD phosphatase RPAP2 homolog n=1 Tax=Coemansia guatemalensis TaxID=2761395 RepID=A0A9W8HSU6_9FUNG|nr:hypothetical protein H4R20_004896 [Coemansia guatemalensis]